MITDLAISLALLGNKGIQLCSPHRFLTRGKHGLGMLLVGNEGGTQIGREGERGRHEGRKEREQGKEVGPYPSNCSHV